MIDVQTVRSFAGEITRASQHSKLMVLIFSAHLNTSEQILREVRLAANSDLHILQFRIADALPDEGWNTISSTPQTNDALTPPLEGNLQRWERQSKRCSIWRRRSGEACGNFRCAIHAL